MAELIERQKAIDIVGQLYRYESDRMTALQEVPTTTEAEIRNKSINEFIRKLKTHPHAQYHLDKYLLEDIYEIAEQLKENEEWTK